MNVLLVLCAVIACVAADCDSLARFKVKDQWSHAYGDGGAHHRVDFGAAMWRSIFIQAPESRKLFDRVNGDDIHSGEFEAHAGRVLEGLGMLISLLDNEEVLESALAHLNKQHKDLQIPKAYFDVFKKALLKIVPASLGKCFDEVAWSDCFDVIEEGIVKA